MNNDLFFHFSAQEPSTTVTNIEESIPDHSKSAQPHDDSSGYHKVASETAADANDHGQMSSDN